MIMNTPTQPGLYWIKVRSLSQHDPGESPAARKELGELLPIIVYDSMLVRVSGRSPMLRVELYGGIGVGRNIWALLESPNYEVTFLSRVEVPDGT